MFPVEGIKTEKVRISISQDELLRLIKNAYYTKFGRGLDIKIEDGFIMRYECTSFHNNDYEYVPLRVATNEEIEQYAFWCQIKELFEEKK